MNSYLKKISSIVGIDKSIFFTSSTSILSSIGSLLSIALIFRFLSLGEQGFFYTFSSLVAIQTFFEMGLNGIIVQFVAHEVSHLNCNDSEKFEGNPKHLSRLASLLRFSIYWYLTFAGVLFFVLILVGFYFFNTYSDSSIIVNWQSPWVLLVFSTVANLMASPFLAFMQGLGKIKEVAQLQFVQLLVRLITLWLGLSFGFKLYVLGFSGIIAILPLIFYFYFKFNKFLIGIWTSKITDKISYKEEIFPFQWKIALSWISGYFIFQLFNPVLFATAGAKVAGQMGVTITALNGILALSTSWISTKIPKFSNLIALKKYLELDNLFNKTIKQSSFVNLFGLIVFLIILFWFDFSNFHLNGMNLRDRFLDYLPLIMMMIPLFINNWVFGLATYLRCHKQEPLMHISITAAILNSLSIYFLANKFGLNGITSGYCIIVVVLFPCTYYVFNKYRYTWHSPNNL